MFFLPLKNSVLIFTLRGNIGALALLFNDIVMQIKSYL